MKVPALFHLPRPHPTVMFTGQMTTCDGGPETCGHPARYEVRDDTYRVQHFCIKHLNEYRYSPRRTVYVPAA